MINFPTGVIRCSLCRLDAAHKSKRSSRSARSSVVLKRNWRSGRRAALLWSTVLFHSKPLVRLILFGFYCRIRIIFLHHFFLPFCNVRFRFTNNRAQLHHTENELQITRRSEISTKKQAPEFGDISVSRAHRALYFYSARFFEVRSLV